MSVARPMVFVALSRLGILAAGVAWVVLLLLTTSSPERDPFDSPLLWWGFVVLPSIAAAGTASGLEDSSLAWAIGLAGPSGVFAFVAGTILHDPDRGASFWLLGEVTVVVLAALVFAGSAVGDHLRRRGAPLHPSRCRKCEAPMATRDGFCRTCGAAA